MRYFVTFPNGNEHAVDLTRNAKGELTASVGDKTFNVEALGGDGDLPEGVFHARLDGEVLDLSVEGSPPELGVVQRSNRFYASVESERMRALGTSAAGAGSGDGAVNSPMPGRVVRVLVDEGASVERGAPVVVVEAMKMENELCAERDGVVTKVHVQAGATVEGGAKLVEIGDA